MMRTLFCNIEPKPLIFTNRNIVVSWSPKAACTHTLLWFLDREGLLKAADEYYAWPHRFRTEVYYQTEGYQKRRSDFQSQDLRDWTLLKITRDPTKRMISSFRHAVRVNVIDELILEQCNINVEKDGLSFVEFSKILSTLDLAVKPDRLVDIHLRKQHHPIWDAEFGKKITINLDEENLNTELNAFADEYDLGRTAFDDHPRFKRLQKGHYARDVSIELGDRPVEGIRLSRQNSKKWFPKTDLLQSRFVRQSAEELYASDYPCVASGTVIQKPVSALRKIYRRLAHR